MKTVNILSVSVLLTIFCCSQEEAIEIKDRGKGSNCDMVINSETSKDGIIASPLYPAPYPSPITCTYDFQGKGNERIQIVFQDFSLHRSIDDTKGCDYQDNLKTFIYLDGKIEKIGSFCGSTLPKPLMSNGLKFRLVFQSLFSSRYARGFKATYKFTERFGIKTGTQLPNYLCAFAFNSNVSKAGYFYSPNYPGLYPSDANCHYFFHGNQNEKIHIHFSYFDIEGVLPCEEASASDYIEFSNFITRDRKYPRYCGQLKEFDVESNRTFFRATFKSNYRLEGTGFNATYEFLDQIESKSIKAHDISGNHATGEQDIVLLAIILILMQIWA